MRPMEFLSENKLNTVTMLYDLPANNTATAAFLWDRKTDMKFTSYGYTTSTTFSLSIYFPSVTAISNIILQNHNLKAFKIKYASETSAAFNDFSVPISFTTNSETSHYFDFSTVTCKVINMSITAATTADTERFIGELIIGNKQLQFERNPNITGYRPLLKRKQIKHEMPDGGTSLYNIRDKYRANLSWKYLTTAFRDSLYSVYAAQNPLYFVPSPTTSSWDGAAYETVWVGDFNFNYSANVKATGWSGDVVLEETASV